MKTVIIFIPGILSNPEDVNAWTDLGVEYINKETDFKAEKMEYKTGPWFTRWFFQEDRAKNLQTICKRYLGWRIVLVAHSNGADIAVKMIKKGIPKIHQVHLIAGAAEADFKKNGLNQALKTKNLSDVFVYVSPIDEALKKARFTSQFFGWTGMAYGFIGLVGKNNVDEKVSDKVHQICKDFKHSQWVQGKDLQELLKSIVDKL